MTASHHTSFVPLSSHLRPGPAFGTRRVKPANSLFCARYVIDLYEAEVPLKYRREINEEPMRRAQVEVRTWGFRIRRQTQSTTKSEGVQLAWSRDLSGSARFGSSSYAGLRG